MHLFTYLTYTEESQPSAFVIRVHHEELLVFCVQMSSPSLLPLCPHCSFSLLLKEGPILSFQASLQIHQMGRWASNLLWPFRASSHHKQDCICLLVYL